MNTTKLSLQMPFTDPITIAGIFTLHGRYTSSPFLRSHGPPLLVASTTNIRSRIQCGELHQIIYNQASFPESDKRGKICTGFKPGKVIIGVVVGLCVIGAMSKRYEAQIMSPMPNFACMSQVFENFMGAKRDKSIAAKQQLDTLIQMAINQLKESSDTQKSASDILFEQVKAASGKEYISGLKEVDDLIKLEEYVKAEKKCKTLKENPSIVISSVDSSIPIREFIALIGQAKAHLENYINETKSLQHLEKQHKQMSDLIHKSTRIVMDEFKMKDLKNTKAEGKIDAFFKGAADLGNTKIQGKDSFLKFMDKMRSAEEKLKEYKRREKERRSPPEL